MITIQILEDEDKIDAEDWCRPLSLMSMSGGHGEGYSFKSQYSGTPENNVEWVKVKHVFGSYHYGCTVKKMRREMKRIGSYEFVRGDIPKRHQLDMKDYYDISKLNKNELSELVTNFKGKTNE
jgi:hypothetical protein